MTTPLKILHLDSEFGYGGGQRQLAFLLEAGKEAGLEQVLACEKNSAIGKIAHKLFIDTRNLKQSNDLDIWNARKLKKIIHGLEPDVVHTHTSRSLGIAYLQRTLFRSKKTPFYINTRRVSFPLSGWLTRKKYSGGADAHICVSQSCLEQLKDFGIAPDKLRVIHSGIRLPENIDKKEALKNLLRLTKFKQTDIILGSSGNLGDVKRFDWLIRATAKIIKTVPHFKLVIFGDGKLMPDLKAQIKLLGLEKSIHLSGHQDQPERFFAGLDIFAMTSELEGLSGSLMDALARGVPLLGSNTPGIKDIIDDSNGLLFDRDSEKDLQAKLLQLASKLDLREKLSKAGPAQAAKRFDIDKVTKKVLDFYQETS